MNNIQILSQIESDEKFPSVYFEIVDEEHFWCRWRMTAFSNMLRELAVDTRAAWSVLDVGCGNGVVRRQLEALTAWTTDGTDFPMEALERNIGVRGATYRYNVYDERPEFREHYDAVVLFDVLEHIEDPRRFLKSLAFHLKPGGWLFINVPALEALRSPYDEVQGHLRRYTPSLLRREICGMEFEERAMTYWGMLQIPLLAMRKIVLTLLTKKENIYTTGFQPPAGFLNSALLGLMKFETAVLRHPMIGTSVLGAFQKKP
jgi:SAM-dependent methyltransferase